MGRRDDLTEKALGLLDSLAARQDKLASDAEADKSEIERLRLAHQTVVDEYHERDLTAGHDLGLGFRMKEISLAALAHTGDQVVPKPRCACGTSLSVCWKCYEARCLRCDPYEASGLEACGDDTASLHPPDVSGSESGVDVESGKPPMPVTDEGQTPSQRSDSSDPLTFDPDWTVHPGATLKSWLDGAMYSAWWKFCLAIGGIDTAQLERLLNGDEPLTPEIARKLSNVTGISEAMWLNLERKFREALAEGKVWDRS